MILKNKKNLLLLITRYTFLLIGAVFILINVYISWKFPDLTYRKLLLENTNNYTFNYFIGFISIIISIILKGKY
jgi:hypothetical protein